MHYSWKSKAGTFTIAERAGRWHIMFRDESLGSYPSPQHAASDLADGHTFTPSGGYDTSALGISDDIEDWTRTP